MADVDQAFDGPPRVIRHGGAAVDECHRCCAIVQHDQRADDLGGGLQAGFGHERRKEIPQPLPMSGQDALSWVVGGRDLGAE